MLRITAAALGAAMLMSGTADAQARRLDPTKPADAITIARKMACSTRDAEPAVYHWSGKAYSRAPGERDRHLFNIEGMNVRHCTTVRDPQKGVGYRMTSRELMLYLDPATGQVLRSWTNPWTNEAVEVVHTANDPVNMSSPSFERNDRGEPFKFRGRIDNGRVFMPSEIPLFYKNPLAGEYQDYVGNQYQAMEIFNFSAEEADLFDATRTSANPVIAWTRIAEWLPFMRMGDRPGIMIINAMGHRVGGIQALPAVLRQEIATNYPIYSAPPPLNDARPNETSWTYFKKWVDAKKPAAAAPAAH